MSDRIICEPLDWADIRLFFLENPKARAQLELNIDQINDIISGDTSELRNALMRELSVWIDGYLSANRSMLDILGGADVI